MADWRHQAACRNRNPDMWTPKDHSLPAYEARAICWGECPVRLRCGEWALRARETTLIAGGRRLWDEQDRAALCSELPHINAKLVAPTSRTVTCPCGAAFTTTTGAACCVPCRNGLKPAGPVADRIRALNEVMNFREMAALTGVAANRLCAIASFLNPPEWVRTSTAERILAVEVTEVVSV